MNRKGDTCKGKVMVLGNDNRSFLSVCRSLGRKSICVHVGWCDKDLPALKSKYIHKYQHIPLYSINNNHWKNVFISILKKEKYDLVIPCNDQSIIPLQKYKKEFETICKLYLLNDDCYQISNDKYSMQQLVKQLRINVPKEIIINKSTSIDYIISNLSLPVVIKPRHSFTIDKLKQKTLVQKFFSKKDFKDYLKTVDTTEILIAQQNFIGKGAGIEVLADEGEILFAFEHIRIHEPLTGGGSSYRKSVPIHSELLEASKKIMKALNYTGVAMLEFKINLKTGQWIFIELNARFWGSLPLAVTAGADFPYFLFLLLIHQQKKFQPEYSKGIYCRNISSDLKWLFKNFKTDRTIPALETRPLPLVFSEIFNILLLKERYDTFSIDDIKPGIIEIRNIISKLHIKASESINSKKLFPLFQKRKFYHLIKTAQSIVFICKGNINRSPFAHYCLKSILSDTIKIQSCGYYPEEGRHCPENAIKVAQLFDLDLTQHRSKIMTQAVITSADILFTFDEENYRTVIKKFPDAKLKIYRITYLLENDPLIIQDPDGMDIRYYYNTYYQIKELIDSFVRIRC